MATLSTSSEQGTAPECGHTFVDESCALHYDAASTTLQLYPRARDVPPPFLPPCPRVKSVSCACVSFHWYSSALLTDVIRLSLAHSFLSRVIPLNASRDCKWLLDKCSAVRPVNPSSPFVSFRLHSVMLRVSRPERVVIAAVRLNGMAGEHE